MPTAKQRDFEVTMNRKSCLNANQTARKGAQQMQNPSIPAPDTVAALEKVPHAARRMCVSTSHAYREIKAGRLGPLVKIGERASAVLTASVDAWIQSKIDAAKGCVAYVRAANAEEAKQAAERLPHKAAFKAMAAREVK